MGRPHASKLTPISLSSPSEGLLLVSAAVSIIFLFPEMETVGAEVKKEERRWRRWSCERREGRAEATEPLQGASPEYLAWRLGAETCHR